MMSNTKSIEAENQRRIGWIVFIGLGVMVLVLFVLPVIISPDDDAPLPGLIEEDEATEEAPTPEVTPEASRTQSANATQQPLAGWVVADGDALILWVDAGT